MKPTVAITAGDINGVGYEILLKGLEDSHILELCKPIVYGNAKIAKQHAALLTDEVKQLQFNIISDAASAAEGKVNLITCYPDDTPLQIGVSKRLVGSPLRFSATLVRLNDWEYGIGKHLVFGADLLLGSQFYVSAGYNAMRASEMKISSGDEGQSSHGAGLSFGGGLSLERFKLHVAYAKYHVSAPSLLVNVSYTL